MICHYLNNLANSVATKSKKKIVKIEKISNKKFKEIEKYIHKKFLIMSLIDFCLFTIVPYIWLVENFDICFILYFLIFSFINIILIYFERKFLFI